MGILVVVGILFGMILDRHSMVIPRRGNFAIRADQLWATMMQSWGLGKWLFASQIAVSAQAYVAHWLLAWVAGARATGVYAACMSIISFANPLILGLGNILTPRAAT